MSKQKPTAPESLTRRDFLKGAGALTVAGAMVTGDEANRATLAAPTTGALAQAKPEGFNILLIVTDQERFGLNFPEPVSLPNHERLQARGLTFSQYHATTGLCTPSRSVIYTGQHVPRTRMTDNVDLPYVRELSTNLPTTGHMLRDAGYYTAFKGKWHLSHIEEAKVASDGRCYKIDEAGEFLIDGQGHRLETNISSALEPYGFADYNPCQVTHNSVRDGYNHDGILAADAADWLQNRAPDIAQSQPWFLAINFVNPHDVMYFDSDETGSDIQVSNTFDIMAPPADPLYAEDWQPTMPQSFFDDDLSAKPTAHQNFLRFNDYIYGQIPADRLDMWQNRQNYYINCVRDVDRHLGTVLDALEASGQAEQTIIIYTSDHGELGGAHGGLTQKGPFVYKENNNVPLILVHPGLLDLAGQTTEALASSVDLVPTLLALAGVPEAERQTKYPALAGYDFSGVLQQPAGQSERSRRAGGLLFTYDALNSVDPDFGRKVHEIRARRAAGQPLDLVAYLPILDLSQRGFLRGMYDGRYKFARYFSPIDYHRPEDWDTLLAGNDLELYDTLADPGELDNLANPDRPGFDRDLVLEMNRKLNLLIEAEIGPDEGLLPLPRFELLS